MIVLNFTHPLTEEQCCQVEQLSGQAIQEVRTIPVQIDQEKPLVQQVVALVDTVNLTAQEWQAQALLINPPGLAPVALMLLAEIHGRIGYFPTILHIRPRQGAITSYEVAELINLQHLREEARKKRL